MLALRTYSSPGVKGSVTSTPSSLNSLISMPGAGRPHDPGLRNWSAGARTVSTPISVEPYTSHSESVGKVGEVPLLECE